MEFLELVLAYAERHLGRAPEPASAEKVSPAAALELLWEFHPLFTPRMPAIEATPYSTSFDREADNALLRMAETDSFDAWEGLSAGAWRVLQERLTYVETVAVVNEAKGTGVFTSVPSGLARQQKARFVLLLQLLGPGRTVDRQLLSRSKPGSASAFPSGQTLRRQ